MKEGVQHWNIPTVSVYQGRLHGKSMEKLWSSELLRCKAKVKKIKGINLNYYLKSDLLLALLKAVSLELQRLQAKFLLASLQRRIPYTRVRRA